MDFENDRLLAKHSKLINDQFRRWYLKVFFHLGARKVDKIAAGVKSQYKHPLERKIAFSRALRRSTFSKYKDYRPRL